MPRSRFRRYLPAILSAVAALAFASLGMASASADDNGEAVLKITPQETSIGPEAQTHRLSFDVYNEGDAEALDVRLHFSIEPVDDGLGPDAIALGPFNPDASCDPYVENTLEITCDLGDIGPGQVRHMDDITIFVPADAKATAATATVEADGPIDPDHSKMEQDMFIARGESGIDMGVWSVDSVHLEKDSATPFGREEIGLYNQGAVDAVGVEMVLRYPEDAEFTLPAACEDTGHRIVYCVFPELTVPAGTGPQHGLERLDLAELTLADDVYGAKSLGFIDGYVSALNTSSTEAKSLQSADSDDIVVAAELGDSDNLLLVGVEADGGEEPSPSPSDEPTETATESPSASPTVEPTETGTSTEEPTETGSADPTDSKSPSESESDAPTTTDGPQPKLPVTGTSYMSLIWYSAAALSAGAALVFLTRSRKTA
ncbi:hypothetical protein [Salininema proteolyticum]|uniref:Gram-positive cocci surface proteins LPxTG domain-containing protein n=1 Tax=Salininema proteolyticum TaxID=1607685 RepID=A0ABV8U3E2_9ACTN